MTNSYDIKYFPRQSFGVEELVSDPMVLESAAGFYIGELCLDQEYKIPMPYSRLSFGYYQTREEAQQELDELTQEYQKWKLTKKKYYHQPFL